MKNENLVEEIIENMDDVGKFFFVLLAMSLVRPEIQEELEKAYIA